jgi:hypothetical protein
MRARFATLLLATTWMCAGAHAKDGFTAPTSDAFLKGIRSYPFAADTARRTKIRLGVPQLTRCMTSAEVRKRIADPDYGYVAFKSGTHGKVPAMLIWHYVLEKKTATEAEPSSLVVLWFDTNAKLQTVAVHGASDIEATVSRVGPKCD